MKKLKKHTNRFKEKIVDSKLDEYSASLSEYILGIVIGVIIFFVIISLIFGILNWAGESFNDLFNWTAMVGKIKVYDCIFNLSQIV